MTWKSSCQRGVCDYIFQALIIFFTYIRMQMFMGLMLNSTEDCICFRSTKSSVTDERIANILSYLTYEVWAFTLRSLYERHKILFTLMLAMKIDCHKGLISHDEFSAFIKGESMPAETQLWRSGGRPVRLLNFCTLKYISSIDSS